MTFTAAAAVSSVHAGDRGSCTDTKCGGAAKECSEGSPHLQKKDMPLGVGSVRLRFLQWMEEWWQW